MSVISNIAWAIAILSTAILYGTDIFFAVVGRKALANSTAAGVADVMGNIHAVGDARMPIFGVAAILSTIVFMVTVGFGTLLSWLGALALAGLLAFLGLYLAFSRPVNARLRVAASTHQTPPDTLALQARWDNVVIARSAVLVISLFSLILATLL